MAITFVNPYNFIPLSEAVNKSRESVNNRQELFSGKIKYTLRTATPLFIPNTSNDQYFDIHADHETNEEYHKSYDFYSYTDLSGKSAKDGNKYAPVIPGSEIRGAVRSLYEALTDSCFSAMDSDAILSRRTPQRYIPGILSHSNNEWKLQEAEDYICRDHTDFSKRNSAGSTMIDGSKVSFSVTQRRRGKPFADLSGSGKSGYLLKGNDGPILPKGKASKCGDCPSATRAKCEKENGKKCYLLMKHNYHVFSAKKTSGNKVTDSGIKQVNDASIKQFSNVLDLYDQNAGAAYKEYVESWKKVRKSGGAIPVYYNYADDKKELLYLSPACITREVYQNTLKKVLGTRYSTCSNKECLCPACQLFGIVNTENGVQKTSSVRFSDMVVQDREEYYKDPVTLEELGAPKPSSMEFYLKRPNVQLNKGETLLVWTYDYYIVAKADGSTRVELYDPEIAGRKMYWHSQKAADRQLTMEKAKELEGTKDDKDKDVYITIRNKTVRPVDRNVEFEGYLYFDRISEKELQRLIAILDMSNHKIKGKRYAMKLGAAKPLGFGSVETRVDSVSLRKLAMEEELLGFKEGEYYDERPSMMDAGIFASATEANLEMLNLDAIDEQKYTVHYPYVKENDALSGREEGFNWFVKNREAFRYKKKENPRNGKMIDDRDHIDLRSTNINPGERKQVPFRQYMQAPNPVLVVNSPANGEKKAAGSKANKILFLAGYPFSDSQKEKLERMSGLSVDYKKEWPNDENIIKYSEEYVGIALPGNAYPRFIDSSKRYCACVYQALKKGDFDDGWDCKKN